ncbi:MAG: helix-turn-helix domain-containing protein [Treponema sp.]|nr:helix-turn-helix domain-containing protein [Treponema sp.]
MRIDNLSTDKQILKELGERIKTARIRAKLTQADLCNESGVGKSTVERVEQGESIQLLNLVKIMRSLNMLSQLDALFPVYEISPMEYLKLSEKKGSYTPAKRVYKKRTGSDLSETQFIWGEDK